MKIICGFDHPIMNGWATTLRSIGVDFLFWNRGAKPVFDLFDEMKFDIFIIDQKELDQSPSILKCLQQNLNVQCLAYGTDFTFEEFPPAADVITYNKSIPKNDRFSCLISYIGDYSAYAEEFLAPLYDKGLRIFGNGWNTPCAVGALSREMYGVVYKNSNLVLDIIEPGNFSDVACNVNVCGTVCLNNKKWMLDFDPDIILGITKDIYEENILQEIEKEILEGETYHHRMVNLFTKLNYPNIVRSLRDEGVKHGIKGL